MIKEIFVYLFSGWRAIHCFGLPAPYKMVNVRLSAPLHGKKSHAASLTPEYCFLIYTNKGVYKTERIVNAPKFLNGKGSTDENIKKKASFFATVPTDCKPIYWQKVN